MKTAYSFVVYLAEWTQAVNTHGGFGRWRYAVAKAPGEIRGILMPIPEAASACTPASRTNRKLGGNLRA